MAETFFVLLSPTNLRDCGFIPQDTITFVQLVSSAIPVICELLHSRQTTDTVEAIDFFTSAFQFGMADAIIGVRQMLVLVWSRDQAVRDAVAVAYRKLYLSTEYTTPRYVYYLNQGSAIPGCCDTWNFLHMCSAAGKNGK